MSARAADDGKWPSCAWNKSRKSIEQWKQPWWGCLTCYAAEITDSGNKQRKVSIPLFQRRYVWKKKNFDQLVEDLKAIEDGQDSARFLGTIVAVSKQKSFSDYEEAEIVDGQQRTISIYLFLCAIVELASDIGEIKTAARIVTRFLIFQEKDMETSTTLIPSLEDRYEFFQIMEILRGNKQLTEELKPFEIRPPAVTGIDPPAQRQEMLSQYFRVRKYLVQRIEGLTDEEKVEFLDSISTILTSHLTFVSLKLRDPASAPLIFQSLNEKGVKTTIGDLVRNEIFSKVYEDPSKAKAVYRHDWEPFIRKFALKFDDYLFPYCLTHDHTITKSECFQELRKLWADIVEPSDIIAQLDMYSDTFIALEHNQVSAFEKDIAEQLSRFYFAGIPSSTFPFIFQVVQAYTSGKAVLDETLGTLAVVESFLLRRAICGIEPTGLHAVFKTLWSDIGNTVNESKTATKLKSLKTQEWPSDSQVKQAILERPLYHARIVRFFLMELELSQEADLTEPTFQIEHVLPQTLNKEWQDAGFTAEEHDQLKDTIGNLVTLSEPLNKKVSQALYGVKRQKYALKSKFAIARTVAQNYEEWEPKTITERSKEIGDWAIKRWVR